MNDDRADVAPNGASARPPADVTRLATSDASGIAETYPVVTIAAPAPLIPPGRKPSTRRPRATRASASPDDTSSAVPEAQHPRSRTRKTAGPSLSSAQPQGAAPPDISSPGASSSRSRRPGARARESGVLGLTERSRHALDRHSLGPLLDMLTPSLPGMRHALLQGSLDEGLRTLVTGLVKALEPAAAQCWLADTTPWASETGRVGGVELTPALRLRAATSSEINTPDAASETMPLPRVAISADRLIAEVAGSRRPVVLFDADEHALAQTWRARLPEPSAPPAALFSALATPPPPPSLGTLAAYPLKARGQFLGVLAVATRLRLTQRQLSSLEEMCDLVALAADRDRLLSYSRSQEALAQTVVRDTPVALAVLSGPEHIFALANPTFALLLGLDVGVNLIGRRLADVIPEHMRSLAASLRLDAVYTGGEPQAMLELPIHQDRGMTYWNVTSSPLAGVSTATSGVLVAAVDVTWQVMARQRAQESADATQERIGQMMALHATTLATASQLGADPHDLLADILRRSI
ncbi:MAG TPA: PAS domain-containing protein, partial [Ktedonobacterales bacterium]|nr:PAS domain-containing protein [Ktedonobacterales bacterium]